MDAFKILIESDKIPFEWRLEDDKMLSRFVIKLVQWKWEPDNAFDTVLFKALEKWYHKTQE